MADTFHRCRRKRNTADSGYGSEQPLDRRWSQEFAHEVRNNLSSNLTFIVHRPFFLFPARSLVACQSVASFALIGFRSSSSQTTLTNLALRVSVACSLTPREEVEEEGEVNSTQKMLADLPTERSPTDLRAMSLTL